jgi:hydrogenase/urease accessory protein HupE
MIVYKLPHGALARGVGTPVAHCDLQIRIVAAGLQAGSIRDARPAQALYPVHAAATAARDSIVDIMITIVFEVKFHVDRSSLFQIAGGRRSANN